MKIDLTEITSGCPGITPRFGNHIYEGCVVCLKRKNHNNLGTPFVIMNDTSTHELVWDDIFNEQVDRTWKDQDEATEYGAVCIAVLLTLKNTDYTVIEKSAKKNGFDYWLGDKEDILFDKKAKLEVSGIFTGEDKEVNKRFQSKAKRLSKYGSSHLPAYIGIVEFGKPTAKFELK